MALPTPPSSNFAVSGLKVVTPFFGWSRGEDKLSSPFKLNLELQVTATLLPPLLPLLSPHTLSRLLDIALANLEAQET